ncbi:MAG: hypothetical protein WCG81_21600, partial [Candidatus Angelobacter sp.]
PWMLRTDTAYPEVVHIETSPWMPWQANVHRFRLDGKETTSVHGAFYQGVPTQGFPFTHE